MSLCVIERDKPPPSSSQWAGDMWAGLVDTSAVCIGLDVEGSFVAAAQAASVVSVRPRVDFGNFAAVYAGVGGWVGLFDTVPDAQSGVSLQAGARLRLLNVVEAGPRYIANLNGPDYLLAEAGLNYPGFGGELSPLSLAVNLGLGLQVEDPGLAGSLSLAVRW